MTDRGAPGIVGSPAHAGLRDDRLVPGTSGPVPSWAELSREQHYLLYEGLAGSTLIDALNGWVCWACNQDAPYWNRKGAYVAPLAKAARSLVEAGLTEIWEEPVGVGEGGLMLPGLAAEAVSNPASWWRYDPDGNWDPDEDLTRYAEFAGTCPEPMTTLYTLMTAKTAREHGLVRYPWW